MQAGNLAGASGEPEYRPETGQWSVSGDSPLWSVVLTGVHSGALPEQKPRERIRLIHRPICPSLTLHPSLVPQNAGKLLKRFRIEGFNLTDRFHQPDPPQRSHQGLGKGIRFLNPLQNEAFHPIKLGPGSLFAAGKKWGRHPGPILLTTNPFPFDQFSGKSFQFGCVGGHWPTLVFRGRWACKPNTHSPLLSLGDQDPGEKPAR